MFWPYVDPGSGQLMGSQIFSTTNHRPTPGISPIPRVSGCWEKLQVSWVNRIFVVLYIYICI